MELNNMLISNGQAHSFAVSVYNDISKYIIQNLEKYIEWLDSKYRVIQTIDGIICFKKVPDFEYKLLMYNL